jgi:hypothetical protein
MEQNAISLPSGHLAAMSRLPTQFPRVIMRLEKNYKELKNIGKIGTL